jgi:hypothetical protein
LRECPFWRNTKAKYEQTKGAEQLQWGASLNVGNGSTIADFLAIPKRSEGSLLEEKLWLYGNKLSAEALGAQTCQLFPAIPVTF